MVMRVLSDDPLARWTIVVFVIASLAGTAPGMVFAQAATKPQPATRTVIVGEDETLKGHTSLALSVDVTERHLSADSFRTGLEARLRDRGITIRDTGYPRLALNINAFMTDPARYFVYSISLQFVQALPLASGAPGSLAEAPTWSRSAYGIGQSVTSKEFRESVDELITDFLGSYLLVNPGLIKAAAPAEARIELIVSQGSLFGTFPSQNSPHYELAMNQLKGVVEAKQQTITCLYTSENETRGYRFWYKSPPAGIAEMLKTWPGDRAHPFAHYGTSAVEACPAAPEVAAKLRRDGRVQR
jgi:hypothetical protein